MNVEKFLQLIESPASIGKAEMEDLESLSSRYPWFFSSRQLQLYYHKNHNDIHFSDYLTEWSFSCPSPKTLYYYLNVESSEAETKTLTHDAAEVVTEIKIPEEQVVSETMVISEEPEKVTEIPSVKAEPVIEITPITEAPAIDPTVPAGITAAITNEEIKTTETVAEESVINVHTEPVSKETVNEEITIPNTEPVKEEIIIPEPEVSEIKNELIEEVHPEPAKDEIKISEPEPVVTETKVEAAPVESKTSKESLAEIILKRCEEIKKKKLAESSVQENTISESLAEVKDAEPVKEESIFISPEVAAEPIKEEISKVSAEKSEPEPVKVEVTPIAHKTQEPEAAVEIVVPVVKEEPKIIEPVKSVPEPEKIKKKYAEDNSDIVREEGETYADFVIRRCSEIKKRRQEEAEPIKKEIPAPVVQKEEPVVVPVIKEELPKPEISLQEEPVAEKTEEIVIPDFSFNSRSFVVSPQQDEEQEKPGEPESAEEYAGSADEETSQVSSRLSDMFSGLPSMEDLLAPAEESDPEETSLTEIKVPFDTFVPAYDISELEKAAEEKVDFTNKKMDFADWLAEMDKAVPIQSGKQSAVPDIIERFIKSEPKIVIRHDSDSQSPYTAAQPEAEEIPDVCTETLAEILVIQDKKEEAIKMYKKLCLLYPEKNTYFAARIEKIQNNEV